MFLRALIFVLFFLPAPFLLHAQGSILPQDSPFSSVLKDGLVPCGNNVTVDTSTDGKICYVGECSLCDAQVLATNILVVLVIIAVLFFGLLCVYAGGLLVFTPFNIGNIGKAYRVLRRALVGLVLVLASWLVVDMLMRALYAGDETEYGPWNEFLCKGDVEKNCFDVVEKLDLHATSTPLATFDCESYGGACTNTTRCSMQTVSGAVGCGDGQLCCAGRGWKPPVMSDLGEEVGNLIDPCTGVRQLRDAGVSIGGSCSCGNRVAETTISGIEQIRAENPSKKFHVTSLTCEKHKSTAHPSGIAADLRTWDGYVHEAITESWVPVPEAQWSDGTIIYQHPTSAIRCALESDHLHCEFSSYSQTRNR